MMCNPDPFALDRDHDLPESHRRLGERLDLFHFSDIAPGAPFWHPDGMAIMESLSQLWRESGRRYGMQEVRTPQLYDVSLWQQSGHADKFADLMYSMHADGRQLGLKPMNCPAHIDIYRSRPRSWRELPVRLSEQGIVHRLEPSGNLNGILRARQFMIDDAHVFCALDDVREELVRSLRLACDIYRVLDLTPDIELSLRPAQRLGSEQEWDDAEAALAGALEEVGLEWVERPGEGAFYGPKIDMHLSDRRGRAWQLATTQLDLQLPRRFGLEYRDRDNQLARPAMVHRASFGSFERLIGLLLDRWEGWWPLWLAPVAVRVLPVNDDVLPACRRIVDELLDGGVRAALDPPPARLGARIKAAHERRIPVVIVVGQAEVDDDAVVVRRHASDEKRRDLRELAVAALIDEVTSRAAGPTEERLQDGGA